MTLNSDFLPAERLPRSQILGQARQIGESPVLVAMLDTAPGLLGLLNQERQIVFCNEACVQAGGLASKSDVLGMRPGELLRCVHAEDMPGGCGTSDSCRHCGLVKALVIGQQGHAASGECLLQRHNHRRDISVEYSVRVQPLPQMGTGWQCFSLSDIGAEKRRVALERIFFHDVMNRAGALEGMTTLLIENDLSPEERAEFDGMLSLSARALVEELRSQRTLITAESGDLAVESSDCDSLEALRNAVAACQSFGVGEAKQLDIRPEAESLNFRTDPTLLGRILVNLIKNGLEASGTGSTVTVTCGLAGPGRIRFSVHNETVMPDHVRAHVFHRSFSTKAPGRGLGTYSIKLLAESYLGGRAWFDSAAGEGTSFHVEFDL